ncbi:MAG: hypothetical protein ACRENP_13880 [Longimicrobiales bacterium]
MRPCGIANILLALLLVGCGKSFPPLPDTPPVAEPAVDAVESVIFLIGDAGAGTLETSPLLRHLRAAVERQSQWLSDSAVTVLFLGDNVYPGGVREPGGREFEQDSTHLQAQLDVVAGPHARAQRTRALFIAGNHDWGHKPGAPGRARLDNMQRLIERRARAGRFQAALLPPAGEPGPGVILIGRRLKLLLIDTAWWLLEADLREKQRFLEALDRNVRNLQGRDLIVAAHHPWQSGGPHGGLVPFWRTIGMRWLLSRSGALLQDLNSLPYRDLKNQFSAVFARYEPPLLFAGGHDHNLQVIRATTPNEPRFNIVSGAGSKSSQAGRTDGMLFQSDEPGYMRLAVLKSGAIELFVVSADSDYLLCDDSSPDKRNICLDEGVNAFRTVFSMRLK